jgi:hypothetical protein
MSHQKKLLFHFLALFLFAFFVFGISLFFRDGRVAGIFKKQTKVKPTMSLSLGKETVNGEEKIKIYGAISPVKAGVRVTLSKRAGKKKKYRNFARPRTDANGEYYQHITPDSSIKSIQAKAKVSKKNLTRKTNFDLNSIPDLDDEEEGGGGGTDDNLTSLPACGTQTEFFSAYPINPDHTTNIVPLGNVNPSGHVFPTDHIYFYIVKQEPGNPLSPPVETPLYSPGSVRVTSIEVSEHLSESPPYSDYALTFYPCDNIYFKFSHVTSLAQKFLDQLVPPYASETTYETGGETYHLYSKTVSMDLTAGEEIGTAGGRLGQNALDFYAYDNQNVSLAFANASRWYDFTSHTACPVDYYSSDKKTALRAKFGSESYQRTTEPVCGRIDQDVSGTAKGAWFKPGSPSHPEDPHLSLIDYNVNPAYQLFSVGTSMSASGLITGSYSFTPAGSGSVNPDFQNVTTSSGVVCYEPYAANTIILLELTSATTIRVEKQVASNCGSGPWSFGATYTDFER